VKLLRLEAWRSSLTLETPYEVAYTRHETAENVFLRLVTDGPLVGLGCAGPSPHVTGEDAADVVASLRERAAPCLEGADATRLAPLLEALEQALPGKPAARAAADMALHDLAAKRAGAPLWKLLGGQRAGMLTSMTVGILPPEETLAEARRHLEAGFRSLKLKGGHDLEGDLTRCRAVRELAGPEVLISFDANQGYDLERAVAFRHRAAELDLAYLEQPTPQAAPELLAEVAARAPEGPPLMADECLMSPADALALAARGGVELFNLKLMRLGGLAPARQVLEVGRAGGVASMVGCMDEAALAIGAGLALALSSPAVRYADLDGHIGLGGDPAPGAVNLREGVLYPAPGPGLGVEDWPEG